MTDTDLIARLYPFEDSIRYAMDAIELEENRSRRVPGRPNRPSLDPRPDRYSRRDRQPTQEPEDLGDSLDHTPCLELRFSQGPRSRYGLVFGLDPLCDIVLPNVPGISFHHLAITFDQQSRPIVQDLGSLYGTEVTYDKEGQGARTNFVWIVGGHNIPRKKKNIIIRIHKHLKFLMVVYQHDKTSQQYIDNINRFNQGTADAENLVNQLDLGSRLQTAHASGARTPGAGPIYLRKKLGEGAFGVVTHFWDVSTGCHKGAF
jgi:serine/threonine-protein kinase Chk2